MPTKLKRTLHIGLGGTGLNALLKAKQCYIEAFGEVPPMIAFLAIDTDTLSRDQSRIAKNGQTVKMTDDEIAFLGIHGNALHIYTNYASNYDWMPAGNAIHLRGLINKGAGQIRSNGRFLLQHNKEPLLTKIEQCISRLSAPIPPDSPFEVDYNKDGVEFPTYVNIVGSVAGGTGAGTTIDLLVLLADRLSRFGHSTSIRPWLVLPDIFRHEHPGVLSENVFVNAYGVLSELDYIYHMTEIGAKPLSFRFASISYHPEEIGDAVLFNMTNTAGVSYQKAEDLAETLGRCMFIDSNKYSSNIASAFDNSQHSTGHDIKGKIAHYFSAGSAELIYDNNAVANVVADTIIARICENLRAGSDVWGQAEAAKWMMLEEVRIQEHKADQLTDDLLALESPYTLTIGSKHQKEDIDAYIKSSTDTQEIHENIANKEREKLSTVISLLNEKINEILNTKGVGDALAFLKALNGNLQVCDQEMQNELKVLNEKIDSPWDWSIDLSNLRTSTWGIPRFDSEGAIILANRIDEDIVQTKRDALRHRWAINFYSDLQKEVNDLISQINLLKQHLDSIKEKQIQKINAIRAISTKTSHFQILLHEDDVLNVPDLDGNDLFNLLREALHVSDWKGQSIDLIESALWRFAKNHKEALKARNVTIEDKLNSLPADEVKKLISDLKLKSSPMWSTNTRGQEDRARNLVTMFVIGTPQGEDSMLNTPEYASLFRANGFAPNFAKTNLDDRVTVIQVESANPLFAIVNMAAYEQEAKSRDEHNRHYNNSAPQYYIDQKWRNRMEREEYSVMPKPQIDPILSNWIIATVYGYVKFNPDLTEYYIESELGDLLLGGYLSLGNRRDVAYENFRTYGLYKEVQEKFDRKVNEETYPVVCEKIINIKNDLIHYVDNYAGLGELERLHVKANNPTYKAVMDLLRNEIQFIKTWRP